MPINASVTEYHRMQIDFLKAEKSQVLFFSKNLPTSAHNSSLWSKDLESFPFFGVSTVVGGCVFVAENFFFYRITSSQGRKRGHVFFITFLFSRGVAVVPSFLSCSFPIHAHVSN